MSKSRKKPTKSSSQQIKPRGGTLKPRGSQFGTNPAQGESHVHVPPELMNPGGENGYLDHLMGNDTMLA